LKSVLGLLEVADNDLANPQHHWPVPLQKRGEGGLPDGMIAALASRTLEQIRVADIAQPTGLEKSRRMMCHVD
jgi:hypothetical protein